MILPRQAHTRWCTFSPSAWTHVFGGLNHHIKSRLPWDHQFLKSRPQKKSTLSIPAMFLAIFLARINCQDVSKNDSRCFQSSTIGSFLVFESLDPSLWEFWHCKGELSYLSLLWPVCITHPLGMMFYTPKLWGGLLHYNSSWTVIVLKVISHRFIIKVSIKYWFI